VKKNIKLKIYFVFKIFVIKFRNNALKIFNLNVLKTRFVLRIISIFLIVKI